MQIILTRDLNPSKGMIIGEMFDWPKQLLTEMSIQRAQKVIAEKEGLSLEEVRAKYPNKEAVRYAEGKYPDDYPWYSIGANLAKSMNRQSVGKKRGRPRKESA